MSHHLPSERSAPRSLKGKVALVTGASKRIGRAIAIALADEGVHIVAHDRKAMEAETAKVCDEVVECGARAWSIIADLEKPEEYESLIARAIKAAGRSISLSTTHPCFFRTRSWTSGSAT